MKGVFGHYKSALGNKVLFKMLGSSLIYGLGVYIASVLTPVFYKNIFDQIAFGADYNMLMKSLLFIVIASVSSSVCSRIYEYSASNVMSKAMKTAMDYGVSKLISHSYKFFANNFAGSLVTKAKRFGGEMDSLERIIVQEFAYAIISVVGILLVLFNTSFELALTALIWFLIFFYFMIRMTYKRIPLEREKSLIESKVTGVVSDIVTNVFNIKLFSSKKREDQYLLDILEEEHRTRYKTWSLANHSYTVQNLITICAQVSLIFISILLWSYGETSSGTIVLVISYGATLFHRLGGLGSAIRKFSDSFVRAQEFVDILNEKIDILDPENPEQSIMQKGDVKFNSVYFSYNQRVSVIEDLNLHIKSGEKVGIVGTSGAGKTTITKLLLRFADVTGGSITIDGQDIRAVTQDDLRSVISYVPQDPILFHRSLKDNIAYGRPDASFEEIVEASKQAHADEFIKALPSGYDTLVGERGIKLSGGERQRVAIARAILKNAPILLLDEATSALDSVSEMHIKEALNRLMEGKTTIVIAHRLSTIEKMDRIIVLEKGQIVEEGDHKELLAKKGTYFNFWSHQNGGFIE